MNINKYPDWNKETAYKKYDIVVYIASLYAALDDVPADTKIDDTSKWLLIYKNQAFTNHERFQMLMIEKAAETGSGGESYTAGNGIDITGNVISVDNTIARQSNVNQLNGQVTALYNTTEQLRTDLNGTNQTLSQLTQDVTDDLHFLYAEVDTKQPKPEYELCNQGVGGNVVQIGSIVIDSITYGVYEFYYKTGALPNATTKIFDLTTLLSDFTIKDFINATGITSNGVFIGSGRTDGDNRVIVQQFSKNNKNMTIRSYSDFTLQTATLKIQFIGTKNQ